MHYLRQAVPFSSLSMHKPTVELVFEPGCPHLDLARARLAQALVAAGLNLTWAEWERGPDAPPHVQAFGSPTILVDGQDVAGPGAESVDSSCRVYQTLDGQSGAPGTEQIIEALRRRIGRAEDGRS